MYVCRHASRDRSGRLLALAGLVAAWFFIGAAIARGSDYSDAVTPDHPAAWWRLGEASGTTAADSSGNGVSGAYQSVALGTGSALSDDAGSAATFSGTSSVTAASAPAVNFGAAAFSVEAWVRTTGTGSYTVVAKTAGSYRDCLNASRTVRYGIIAPGWALVVAGGQVRFEIVDSDSIDDLGCHHPHQIVAMGPTTLVNDGTWHYVAASVTPSSGVTVYVDDASATTGGTTSSISNGSAVKLGANLGTSPYSGYVGDLDEVALYASGLSSSQVDAHYSAGSNGWTETDDGQVSNYTNTNVGNELTDSNGDMYLQEFQGADANSEAITCCGPDNSREVTDTTIFPYRAVTWVKFVDGSGTLTGWCSGFLISQNTVATAGHCVYENGAWTARSTIRVVPGANADAQKTEPYGHCGATRLFAPRGWRRSNRIGKVPNENFDYGAIKLDCMVGTTTGYFGLTVLNFPVGNTSIISGYPSQHPQGTMWRSVDQIRSATKYRLFYRNDTFPGDSGAPVYRTANSSCHWCVMAVHTTGGIDTNGGTRITWQVARNLNHWRSS
jgi:glutamyl endopeptidase